MAATREDVELLLQVEQVYKPGRDAKKFVWTDACQEGDGWFDRYGWDSDERMHVNEYSTYFEMLAMLWQKDLVDRELVLDWTPAEQAWSRVGPVLLEARRVLGAPELWSGFEALAKAQAALSEETTTS